MKIHPALGRRPCPPSITVAAALFCTVLTTGAVAESDAGVVGQTSPPNRAPALASLPDPISLPHPSFASWTPDLAALRAAAALGEVVLHDVPLGADRVSLRLHPTSIGAPRVVAAEVTADGTIIEHELPGPDRLHLEGHAIDEPSIRAFLSVVPVGGTGIEGFITRGGETFLVSSGPTTQSSPTLIYRVGATPAELLEIVIPGCQAELLEGYADQTEQASSALAADGGVAGSIPCRAVEISIETDHEYLADLFGGDSQAAVNYIATLFGATSSIYQEQVGARLDVNFIRLWPSASDPWNESGTGAQLGQFRDIWNIAMSGQSRDLAHFLSGRNLGGGVAWLSAICSGGNGYGLSANLNGFFPYPIVDHSGQNWDLMVVAHELGHNFGSPHTHDYTPPLDGCGLGDCQQAYGGTIMSYCHTCSGGLSNMVMEFHPSNVETMLNFLANTPCTTSGEGGSLEADAVVAASGAPRTIDVLANDFGPDCGSPAVVGHSASSAQGGAIALSAGTGPDGRDELVYTSPAGFSGSDSFTYQAQWSGGPVVDAVVSVSVMPLRPADGPSVATPGLTTSYYALNAPSVLPDFALLTPIVEEIVPIVDFPSTGGVFAGSGLADDVGAVFTGWLDAPVAELYELFLESDDGSRLFIGETLVVNNDGLHGMVEQSGLIGLAAGRHALRIEFFERGGGAGIFARWKREGTTKTIIPGTRLSHTSTADLNGDGIVDGADLGILLAAWGSSGSGDLDGNGVIDGADLGLMLAAWN